MHATFQPDGRSPKQINCPTSTSQLKAASDSGQSSGSVPSRIKTKKRERADNSADPIKRERSSRTGDGELLHKTEDNLKSEITRITEKGGVVDLEGVEKLVQLMQPAGKKERKMDLLSRSMLAGVMAATERVDCLDYFVQLRGLPVLDEWLQDIHKGKIGDGNSLKDVDKSVEEFLFILLRALDKLPVNLHALQMCNIGRSVNHLRSHKNLEIQRKARSLVETWKKRVEVEMTSIDAKSATTQGASAWSSRTRLLDASHAGSRTPSGSDIALKNSVAQTSVPKTISTRSSHGESTTKSETSSPGPVKPSSSPSSCKDSRGGILDVAPTREDRSSSSNQSYNQSQSLSVKEGVKSLNAGSVIANNNISSISTRSRKISGFPISVTGGPKETSSGRSSSAHKTVALEKFSLSASSERVLEGPINEGSSHNKLIVKLPNRVSSLSAGVSSGSLQDPTSVSKRASSPVRVDKDEHLDRTSEDKSDTYRNNAPSDINVRSQENNNDSKDVLTGTFGGVGPAEAPDEEHSMTTEDAKRLPEDPPTSKLIPGKLHASSFSPMSPMNALVESCAKYSEANSSLSADDDVGMNLLASVATGEISRSDLVSPTDSTERSTHAERVCIGDEAKSNFILEDSTPGVQRHLCNHADCDGKKQANFDGCSWIEDGSSISKYKLFELSGGKNIDQSHTSEAIPGGEANKELDSKREISDLSNEKTGKLGYKESNEKAHEEKPSSNNINADGISICRSDGNVVMNTEENISTNLLSDEGKLTVEVLEPNQFSQGDCMDVNEELNMGTSALRKQSSAVVKSEFTERVNDEKPLQAAFAHESDLEAGNKINVTESDEKDDKRCMNKSERLNSDVEGDRKAAIKSHGVSGLCSTSNDGKSHHENHETQPKTELRGLKSANIQPDEASSPSAAGKSVLDARIIKFDLNECFSSDDAKYEEPANLKSSDLTTIHMINSSPFSVNSVHSVHSSSITVAAAAKGPFVPPEDLLKSKGELGWKGFATNSAFRPTEPRRVTEIPFGSTNMPCPDPGTNKNSVLFDFDLNVPDERVLEEMASRDSYLVIDSTTDILNNRATSLNKPPGFLPGRGSGGLDLDLNRIDDINDYASCSTSNSRKEDASILHKPLSGLPTRDARRDFDLNDGPGVDDTSTDHFPINQQTRMGTTSQLSSPPGFKMNIPSHGGFSSWFAPGNSYSTVAIPSSLHDRGDQLPFPVFPSNAPQRTFGPSVINPFTPDVYRGQMMSSSPSMNFPPGPFQFPVFPFGTSFPLPSATFPVNATSYATDPASGPRMFAPPVNPQLLGPVGLMATQFQRPYMVSLADNNGAGGSENSSKWGRQGFDLNSGPGFMEGDVRAEMLPISSGQHSLVSAQALAEDHARMYSVSGGILKRKEPEGGWENESFRHKPSPWQ